MLDRNEHVKGCSRSDLSDSDCMKNSQEGAVVRRELWSGGSGGQAGAVVRRELWSGGSGGQGGRGGQTGAAGTKKKQKNQKNQKKYRMPFLLMFF